MVLCTVLQRVLLTETPDPRSHTANCELGGPFFLPAPPQRCIIIMTTVALALFASATLASDGIRASLTSTQGAKCPVKLVTRQSGSYAHSLYPLNSWQLP